MNSQVEVDEVRSMEQPVKQDLENKLLDLQDKKEKIDELLQQLQLLRRPETMNNGQHPVLSITL